ncbi:MAG: alpha/beta hydrolase family protein [Chitinophagaceae bacterium]
MLKYIFSTLIFFLPGISSHAQQEVSFTNENHSIRFTGTLDMPSGKSIFPTVILVSGTGPQDRNGTMGGHPIFKLIAQHLVANGIAVLRTDDRGTGSTTGRYDTSSTADFADDALAAVRYLKSRKDIKGKIGLAGHSEGGAVVCIAAAKSKDVDFVVSLAGLAAPGLIALKAQNQAIVNTTKGISVFKKERLNTLNEQVFDTAYVYRNAADSILIKKIIATHSAWKQKDDSMMRNRADSFQERIYYPADRFAHHAAGKWYRFHIGLDPAGYFPQIKVPVLAINGANDIMVPAETHLPYFKKYIPRAKKRVKTVVIQNMNHLLQTCSSCLPDEYAKPEQQVSPELLKILTAWVLKHS